MSQTDSFTDNTNFEFCLDDNKIFHGKENQV